MLDLIIIGAGPAGLTAGIYAKMANKSVLILEKAWVGGQVANIYKIKNYPGFEEIDGFELTEKMRKQALNLGAEIVQEEVKNVELEGEIKKVVTHKNSYEAKGVIIATGAYARQLDVSNEKNYLGKGLSYCATCDGNFYKDKVVAVVGGGNSSFEDCLYLSSIAKKIYLIHRRDGFRGNESSLEKIKAMSMGQSPKIEILTNMVVSKLIGQERLEQIEITNKVDSTNAILDVDGLFVAIGRKPDTEIFNGQLKLNDGGFIETDEKMRTNVKNVYAVGDSRNTPLRQIVTACGDGAIAVSAFLQDN